ncbi:MAG: hypothetical protein ACQEXJ_04055 [Myxococcota bacterium]
MGRAAWCAWSVAIVGLMAASAARPRAPDAPDLRVLAVDGRATTRASPTGRDDGSPLLLGVLDPLAPGEHVEIARGGSLWLLDASGHPRVLRGPGIWRVTVDGLRRVERGRATGERGGGAERLDLRLMPPGPEAEWREARDGDGHSALAGAPSLAPTETAIRTRRPLLQWRPRWDVRRWDLDLWRLDEAGTLVPVERWTGLSGTVHRPSRPLEPGVFYLWELSPTERVDGTGGQTTSAWFHVLGPDQERALDESLERLSSVRGEHPEAGRALEVLRAMVVERHGLLAEAEAAWRDLPGAGAERGHPVRRHVQRLSGRELIEPRERMRMSRSGLPTLPLCPGEGTSTERPTER